MKEPLFVNVIFDMQYTEIKYFMTNADIRLYTFTPYFLAFLAL